MDKYDNKGRIVLFLADKEDINKNRPDFTGHYHDENGVKKRVVLWSKTSENGTKYMSGKIEEWKPSKHETAKSNAYSPNEPPFDDDIPF